MIKDIQEKLQKYFPLLLVVFTLIVGIFIFVQKGILVFPTLNNKSDTNLTPQNKPALIDVLFTGKEYKLFYSEFPVSDFINIAKYDKSEQWQGLGSIEDDETVFGGAVLVLADRSREKSSAYLLKNLNLSGIDIIKFSVKLKTIPDELEVLNVIFGNKSLTSFYRYPVSNLKEGINYITIPRSRFFFVGQGEKPITGNSNAETVMSTLGWDKIERVEFELISRPGAKASVDIGWVRGEKEDIFLPDWNWDGDKHFFNLDIDSAGKPVLAVQNSGNSNATLKKIGSVKDFDYSVKFLSKNRGKIGLLFRGDYKTGYGYFLTVEGLGTNVWSLSKYNLVDDQAKSTVILNGQISNFEFSKDQPFWLKVTTKGNKLTPYFSLDGKDFTKLGEINDNDFTAGGVGITFSGGSNGYVGDFYLTQ